MGPAHVGYFVLACLCQKLLNEKSFWMCFGEVQGERGGKMVSYFIAGLVGESWDRSGSHDFSFFSFYKHFIEIYTEGFTQVIFTKSKHTCVIVT